MSDSPPGSPRTVADLLRTASHQIAASGSSTARLDAEVLLGKVLNLDRAQLFARLQETASPNDGEAFDALVRRRCAGEPVAYLTGQREFMGLPFKVTPGVLVPRPESEHLVEWAIGWLAGRTGMQVIDVGTGAGIIAAAVARYAPLGSIDRVVATDISIDAVAVARNNIAELGLKGAEVIQADLLDGLPGPFDLVLANLPYLTTEQIAQSPSIAAEPMVALDGGREGLELLMRLIGDLPRVLAPGGAVALEIDPSQDDTVPELLRAALPDATIISQPDLSGRPRLITATLP